MTEGQLYNYLLTVAGLEAFLGVAIILYWPVLGFLGFASSLVLVSASAGTVLAAREFRKARF